jgi:hypothetical protein
MSYAGNLETAEIYLSAGLKDRTEEYIDDVLSSVPQTEKSGDNPVYLKALELKARLRLEAGDREIAANCIDEGLGLKQDHVDFLFLRSLLFWDMQRYDDMFVSLIDYLSAVTGELQPEFKYEYSDKKVVEKVMGELLPEAFRKAVSREQLAQAITAQASNSSNQVIRSIYYVIQEVQEHGS